MNEFIFYVKANNDAHVGLFQNAGSHTLDKCYEIVISGWGNTKSVIRKVENR